MLSFVKDFFKNRAEAKKTILLVAGSWAQGRAWLHQTRTPLDERVVYVDNRYMFGVLGRDPKKCRLVLVGTYRDCPHWPDLKEELIRRGFEV